MIQRKGFDKIRNFLPYVLLQQKKNFRLTKICKKDRKDHLFFVSFRMFSFHGNIFSELSMKRKQHLSANAYFCVNMKFSYTLTGRKDKILFVVLYRKQKIFHQRLGQLFVNNFLSHYSNNKPLDNFSLRYLFFSDIRQQT